MVDYPYQVHTIIKEDKQAGVKYAHAKIEERKCIHRRCFNSDI